MILGLLAIAACHTTGIPPYIRPDNTCTPGAYHHTQPCVHKSRPDLPASDRTLILAAYGVPHWDGKSGELDHRQPFWAGGTTDTRNIWPQPGPIPNPKDRLEAYTYQRVCHRLPHPMRLRTVHRIFAGDWTVAYRKYLPRG